MLAGAVGVGVGVGDCVGVGPGVGVEVGCGGVGPGVGIEVGGVGFDVAGAVGEKLGCIDAGCVEGEAIGCDDGEADGFVVGAAVGVSVAFGATGAGGAGDVCVPPLHAASPKAAMTMAVKIVGRKRFRTLGEVRRCEPTASCALLAREAVRSDGVSDEADDEPDRRNECRKNDEDEIGVHDATSSDEAWNGTTSAKLSCDGTFACSLWSKRSAYAIVARFSMITRYGVV